MTKVLSKMTVFHSAGTAQKTTEPLNSRFRGSCRLFTEIRTQSFCSSHPQRHEGTFLP